MSETNILSRHWWFILYPESAPLDWLDILMERMYPFAVSPLHDRDLDDAGQLKKPHHHIMFLFDGNKTYNKMLELTRSLRQPIPKVYDNARAAYEYLAHVNNPEKAQYDINDITVFNGFVVPSSRMKEEKSVVSARICKYIMDHNILEFADLIVDIMSDQPELSCDLLPMVMRDSYFYSTFIRSIRFKHDYMISSERERQAAHYGEFFRQTQMHQDMSQIPMIGGD